MSGSANSSSSKPQLNPQQIIDLYLKEMPNVLSATFGQATPVAQSIANAATTVNPQYTASGLKQLQDFAPGYAKVGGDVQQQIAANDASTLAGSGRGIATAGNDLLRMIDPEFFDVRASAGKASTDYLNSFNSGKLSPGELAAVERSINQDNTATGNLGNRNALNTATNALNFGNAANAKRTAFGNAIAQVTSTLPALQNSKFNPVTTTLNSNSTGSNFALGQFNPTQGTSSASSASNFGENLFSALAGAGSASKSSSSGASGGVSCCFIFLESYHGKLPDHVRRCRDKYYNAFPQIATGYKRMAKWLVPLMQRSALVRKLVWNTMVSPLTEYGKFVLRRNAEARRYRSVRKFWFAVWNFMGA